MQEEIEKVGLVLLGSLLTAVWLWGIARYESKLKRDADLEAMAYESFFLLLELFSIASIRPAPGASFTPEMSFKIEVEKARIMNRLRSIALELRKGRYASEAELLKSADWRDLPKLQNLAKDLETKLKS